MVIGLVVLDFVGAKVLGCAVDWGDGLDGTLASRFSTLFEDGAGEVGGILTR